MQLKFKCVAIQNCEAGIAVLETTEEMQDVRDGDVVEQVPRSFIDPKTNQPVQLLEEVSKPNIVKKLIKKQGWVNKVVPIQKVSFMGVHTFDPNHEDYEYSIRSAGSLELSITDPNEFNKYKQGECYTFNLGG